MEFSDGLLPPRKRKRTSANSNHQRASRRNSSSSSDILVAAPTATSPRHPPAMEDTKTTMGASLSASTPPMAITARVEDGFKLIIAFNDADAQQAFEDIVGTATAFETPAEPMIRSPSPDDDEGPNSRGTYSKAYVAKHPNMNWVHRGQGRYLPAHLAKGVVPTSVVERRPRLRESRQSNGRADLTKTKNVPDDRPRSLQEFARRRGLDQDPENASVRQPPLEHLSGRPTLRNMNFFDDKPLRSLVTRSSRNAKPEPEADSPERRSSRFSSRRTYNEQDSAPGTDDDMAGDSDQTYDRDYVAAHPGEQFYHTGNGWYKRGERPRGSKAPKKRESTSQATTRLSEGAFKFEAGQTVHSSQLALYPNVEFHHCGNGWYKPGPDTTGHRNSTIFEASPSEVSSQDAAAYYADVLDDRYIDTTVNREYVKAHPEIEWVHRGNGRYRPRAKTAREAVPEPDSPPENSELDSKGDTKTYSRAYVEAHPDEEFHHRGNARYMRGPPPAQWAAARKQRRRSLITEGLAAAAMADVDDGMLYDKAWVDTHPNEKYHHRGQGRYARGDRKPRASLPQTMTYEAVDDESDGDPDELVDTKYVKDHPHETFHHRGQGRWARGLPPIGASNKVAVRGPGINNRLSASTSQAEEEEEEQPPGLMDLVLKSEGPVKFPKLTWHYRGGGKWARMSKQEADDMHKRQTGRKPKSRARKSLDGATAQLEREAAAAEAAAYDVDDEDGYGVLGENQSHLTAKPRAPPTRRRRTNNIATRESFNNMDEDPLLSKQSSQKSVSQAPTPKPRVMTEEEDVLTPEDLPQLYREEWSPPTEEHDEADVLVRERFRPLNGPDVYLPGMTKHEPNTRPTVNLVLLAENADVALKQLSTEYLELEKITAPHRRVPGKPAKGGTVPIDPLTWEDKKEADLYDFHFDQRKIGEQDPDAQRIQRDAEGRELRGRRNRSAFNNTGTVPGWNFGEDQPLGPRRAVKAPQRFDGVVAPPRKRVRNSTTATRGTSQAPSLTPERGMTPMTEPTTLPIASGKGRWAGHVPKRVQELRGESVAASVGPAGGRGSKEGSPVRKGRPPGSKNLHKRKDAGIKKGPRKPKVQDPVAADDANDAAATAAATATEDEVDGDDEDGVEEGATAEEM